LHTCGGLRHERASLYLVRGTAARDGDKSNAREVWFQIFGKYAAESARTSSLCWCAVLSVRHRLSAIVSQLFVSKSADMTIATCYSGALLSNIADGDGVGDGAVKTDCSRGSASLQLRY